MDTNTPLLTSPNFLIPSSLRHTALPCPDTFWSSNSKLLSIPSTNHRPLTCSAFYFLSLPLTLLLLMYLIPIQLSCLCTDSTSSMEMSLFWTLPSAPAPAPPHFLSGFKAYLCVTKHVLLSIRKITHPRGPFENSTPFSMLTTWELLSEVARCTHPAGQLASFGLPQKVFLQKEVLNSITPKTFRENQIQLLSSYPLAHWSWSIQNIGWLGPSFFLSWQFIR